MSVFISSSLAALRWLLILTGWRTEQGTENPRVGGSTPSPGTTRGLDGAPSNEERRGESENIGLLRQHNVNSRKHQGVIREK